WMDVIIIIIIIIKRRERIMKNDMYVDARQHTKEKVG
ncbi:MAG: hypothetical protein ACI8RD_010891, partial [Bacillariaceae sp.]